MEHHMISTLITPFSKPGPPQLPFLCSGFALHFWSSHQRYWAHSSRRSWKLTQVTRKHELSPRRSRPVMTFFQARTEFMETLHLADQGDVAELVCEFLEVCIHQLLRIRELYPPAIFERRRHFNVPVQWARHPDLREYIHSAVTGLQPWIQQGAVEKVAVLFVDGNQIPVEKVIFKLCLKQVAGAGVPASHIEFALRGFLLKLCVADSALSPLPPDCSWELVAYMKTLSADFASKGQFWIPANGSEDSNQSSMITAIKSMRSSCLDMQLYVEHLVEEPQKKVM